MSKKMSEEKKKDIPHFKIFLAWFLVGVLALLAPIPGSFVGYAFVVTPIWFTIWLGLLIFG